MLYALTKPLLFALPPETAHHVAVSALCAAHKIPGGAALLRGLFHDDNPLASRQVMGLRFANPVGLAAGFDKNARAVCAWENLGFGFCEVGTITAKAQPGNPKPRLFRLPADQALINRLGFNNLGAEAVAANLRKAWDAGRQPKIPLGINIGKSKVTPLADAPADYAFSLEKLYDFASYFTVNISSPNTKGLRDLQQGENLSALLQTISEKNKGLARSRNIPAKPLCVKLAPDLSDDELVSSLKMLIEFGIAGVILTNTTLSRHNLKSARAREEGGLSGAPVRARSTAMIKIAKETAGRYLAIIGCGGIFSLEDAREKLDAGAALVQVYTGLIYKGPSLPGKIVAGL